VLTKQCVQAGTERCHEAASKLPSQYDIVFNIQGDEPLMDPCIIDECVRALQNSPEAVYRHVPDSSIHSTTPSNKFVQGSDLN
jgi:3-deoxy-manno-octulosonate cytidylyltransferase (CMP-KDO synthetase)